MADDRRAGPVSIGCGSLIVIGLIVLFFSGGGRIQEMEDELRGLRDEVNELQVVIQDQTQLIQQQTKEIRELTNAVQQNGGPAPR